MSDARRVEKLRRDHPVENFDCGREELNRYLVRYAWQPTGRGGTNFFRKLQSRDRQAFATDFKSTSTAFKRLNRTRAEHRACLHVFAKTRLRFSTSVYRELTYKAATNQGQPRDDTGPELT